MDEDIEIINTNTRNEKIKNFFIINKKKIITFASFIILIAIFYFLFLEIKERNKIQLAERYNKIKSYFLEQTAECHHFYNIPIHF